MKLPDFLFLTFISMITALGITGMIMLLTGFRWSVFGIVCVACSVVSVIFWGTLIVAVVASNRRRKRRDESFDGLIDYFSEKY